jgi:hypothetical protein
MPTDKDTLSPAALPMEKATGYSGLSRTYFYENRHKFDWIKAGRRTLIGRSSIDRHLDELREASQRRDPRDPKGGR